MSLTIDNVEYTVFGNKSVVFADVDFDSSYPTGGEALLPGTVGLTNIELVFVHPKSGYLFEYDYTNEKLKAYYPSAAEESHTHAIALDSGASGAEAAHTHAVALDSGASGAEAAHTHAVALDSGASGAEASHTHAIALDSGASAAGASHNHAFTATGKEIKFVSVLTDSDASASAQGTGEEADEAAAHSDANNSWRVDSDVATTWTVGALGANPLIPICCLIEIENGTGGALDLYEGVMTFTITGTDPYGAVQTEDITVTSSAGTKSVAAAQFRWKVGLKPFRTITNVVLDNVPADALTIRVGFTSKIFIGNIVAEADVLQVIEDGSAITITSNIDATYGTFAHGALAASKVCSYLYERTTGTTGTNAAESTHTHAYGTLADTASGVGSSHTHGAGSLADAASAAGSSHTHASGSLADAASAAGSSHTHASGSLADAASGAATGTAGVGTEVGSTDNLSSLTDVKVMIIGH